jgi:hypothetical protein
MTINLPIPNKNSMTDDETSVPVAAELENQSQACQVNADAKNPQLLLKATRDAEQAKSAVRQAIAQAFREREESLKKAESLAQAFDEAIQNPAAPASPVAGGNAAPGTPHHSPDTANNGFVKKMLVNGSVSSGPLSDIIKTYFGARPHPEAKKAADIPSGGQSPNIRRIIDHVADDQAQKKASRMIGEAKSDRLASRLVVTQAQEDIRKAREEAELIKRNAEQESRRAREEAEISRRDAEEAINLARGWIEQAKSEAAAEKKAAELMASQARQQAFTQAAEEIKKAKDDVKAAKEAAGTAIRLAQAEVSRVREESETYKKNAQAAITTLEEKVMKVMEKVKAIKQQSLISISEAQAEAQRASEQLESTRRECEAIVKQSQMESEQAREEARLETMKAREATIKAEQNAYDQVREKIEQVKAEAETTKQAAYEAVAKAQEESRRAREDAEVVKRASEDAVYKAIEDRRKSEETTEQAKQAMLEFANKAQEDSRKAREEAEMAIMRANDTMIKAQQDIIGMTISEISATRQEIEDTVNHPEKFANTLPEEDAQGRKPAQKLDPALMSTVLHEMRTPLHSISGFARLMLEEDVSDEATRKEFLSIVVQQSEAMTQILDDIAGKMEPVDEPPAEEAPDETAP